MIDDLHYDTFAMSAIQARKQLYSANNLVKRLQRQAIKQTLQQWAQQHQGRIETIFRTIGNVLPAQLADPDLFDFAALQRASDNDVEGAEFTAAARRPVALAGEQADANQTMG